MLSRLINVILKLSFKNHFISKFTIISEIISILITLIIYWFTSKAFSTSVDAHLSAWNGNYFNYLIVGEVFLMLPTYFVQHFSEQIKLAMQNQTFDTLLTLPISPIKSVFTLGMLGFSTEVYRTMLMLGLSFVFFGFTLPLNSLLSLFSLQIISIISFLGLGLIAASFLISTGRGQAIINYFCLFGSFFSGAYFPLNVLPEFFTNWAQYFSPFSTVMIYTRKIIIAPHDISLLLTSIMILAIMGVIFITLGYLSLLFSIKHWTKRDSRILFTRT